MDRVDCANCGKTLTDPAAPCPDCGATESLIMLNMLKIPVIRDSITFSFRHRHKMWAYELKAIRFNLDGIDGQTDGELIKGLCSTAIKNTAALVEAVLTDHLKEEWESWLFDDTRRVTCKARLAKVRFSNWRVKKGWAGDLDWDLKVLDGFDMVDTLFAIRDNLGHGASYDMEDERMYRDDAYRRVGSINIDNESYRIAYEKLADLRLLPPATDHPQIVTEAFLVPAVARWLFDNAVGFVRSFFDHYRLSNNYNMRPEFERPLGEWPAGNTKTGQP